MPEAREDSAEFDRSKLRAGAHNKRLRRVARSVGILLVAALLLSSCGSRTTPNNDPTPLPLNLELASIASGLLSPVGLANAGDGSGRLFVIEQQGTIRIFQGGALLGSPFLDIRSRVVSGGEMGLLGLAFHPRYSQNARFFLNYTRDVGGQLQTVIAEYHASTTDPNQAETSETVLLIFAQPFSNHNGGQLAFGPDGYLYIATGDGGGGGDPLGNGQNVDTLLGKILRVDVDAASPYAIPPDNPFVDQDGADEIWAYGLRNPWRFSFDPASDRLFAADVGQDTYEEVDLITPGGNYGWNIMEGMHCYPPPTTGCDTAGLILPIAEYTHAEGASVTGGYVYRGALISELRGTYVFGDFGSGTIWGLKEDSSSNWERSLLLETELNISSFGVDQSGEIYVVDHNGAVYRLRKAGS